MTQEEFRAVAQTEQGKQIIAEVVAETFPNLKKTGSDDD